MTVKLKNDGKGKKGTGVNNRIVATIPHATLPVARVITFWASATFEGTTEVDFNDFKAILLNLVEKENENGKFLVWNGQ